MGANFCSLVILLEWFVKLPHDTLPQHTGRLKPSGGAALRLHQKTPREVKPFTMVMINRQHTYIHYI